jgi:hypothetical protein
MGSWGGRQHDGDEAHELEPVVNTTVCHALHWGHSRSMLRISRFGWLVSVPIHIHIYTGWSIK